MPSVNSLYWCMERPRCTNCELGGEAAGRLLRTLSSQLRWTDLMELPTRGQLFPHTANKMNSLDAKFVLYFWDISINACQLKPIHWLIHGEKSTRYFVKSWKHVFQSYKFLKTWHRPHQRLKFQILPKPGFGQRHIYVPMAGKELMCFCGLVVGYWEFAAVWF